MAEQLMVEAPVGHVLFGLVVVAKIAGGVAGNQAGFPWGWSGKGKSGRQSGEMLAELESGQMLG